MNRPRVSTTTLTVLCLIILVAVIRVARDSGWLPLPPNVAPIAAMALFSGALLPRRLTFVIPLAAMLLSDLIIGFYSLPVMLSVYASFALCNIIGLWLRKHQSAIPVIGASLLSSTLFYFITNAAVWKFQKMYPHTLTGLGQSYTMALPFFRNTLIGDLAFTGLFFGIYAAVMVYARRRQRLLVTITNV